MTTFGEMPSFNNKFQVTYLAGYSKDGKTFYVDKRMPRYLKLKSGKTIDTYKYLMVHEQAEKWLEDKFSYKYDYAHKLATSFERDAVEADYIPWEEYQHYMLDAVKQLHEINGPVPPDLDLKPEKDSHDIHMLRIARRYGAQD